MIFVHEVCFSGIQSTGWEDCTMKNGKYKIKRYKVKRGKGLLWALLTLAVAAAALFFLNKEHILSLPAFTIPALSPEAMQQQTRVITLPDGQWFALQLGAFEEEQSARSLADSFRSRGAAGHVYPGDTYRVLAAAYENRESAQAVQAQLALNHGVDAYLYPIARSEVTLRLTGQKAQLDALEDAFCLCDQLTYTLAGLSEALDRGEMTFQEAVQALSSQRETVQALNNRLLARFSRDEHAAVLQLCSILSQTDNLLAQAIQSSGAARLGSGIKACQLYLICSLEEYVRFLSP